MKRDLLESRLIHASVSLSLSLASCAPHQAVREQPSAESSANVAEPADTAPSSEPAVASATPRAPTMLEQQQLDRLAARARGVLLSTANLDPRPVDHTPGSPAWVAFRSSRRGTLLGDLGWYEAPSDTPSEMPIATTAVPPATRCTETIAAGSSSSTPAIHLVRNVDHDEVTVGAGSKMKPVSLPRGAIEGDACVVGTGKHASLWLAWSTPDHPADLLSIAISSGKVRSLRLEGRPGLGGLRDQTTREIATTETLPALSLVEPHFNPGERLPSVLLLSRASNNAPLARWSSLARFLSASGASVVKAADHPSFRVTPDNIDLTALKPLLDSLDARLSTRTTVIIEGSCDALDVDAMSNALRAIDHALEVVCTKRDVDEQAKEWARVASRVLASNH